MTSNVQDRGQGSPFALLLHCSLAHSAAWNGVARRLADRYHLIAPDLVGHGRGPDPDPARDYHDHCAAEALIHLPAAPAHLIGHSFGATVALRLALDHPTRVKSLTLIEPVLFAAAKGKPGWQADECTQAGFMPAYHAGDLEGATRLFLHVWGDGKGFDALPKAHRDALVRRIWVVAASTATLHDDTAGLLPRLSQLVCPVLLLEGDRSPPVIAEIQTALGLAIPGHHRVVIPTAGHMVPITHPIPVAQVIGDHLASIL